MLAIGAGLMQGAGWHAEGIGLAKTVAAVITFSAFMAYYALHPFFKSYQILQWQKPEFSKIFALGGPIALQVLSETGSALGLSSLLGLLGDAALAAQQAAIQWYSIASAPLLCIAQVAGTQVTQANEQQNINSARLYGNVNLGIGLGWSLLCTALFCSMPKYLLSVFIDSADPNNANIMQTASWLMVINALGLIVDGLRNIASGALRGFHDTKTALAVGIISTCLLTLPLAYALEFPAKLNESGVYIARDVGFAAGSAMMLYHWHKKSKQSATVMPLSPTP
jgi:MATE family multidrug resistance protein